MASKKKSSKAVAVRSNTQIGAAKDLRARLAERAAKEESRLAPIGGSNISTRNGVFSVGGDSIGKSMRIVVLNHARWRRYYDRPFDPDNPTVPACFSVSESCDRETVNAMEPAESSPVKQADICFNCDHSQFGSALQGGGKACRDAIHLAVISADDLEEEEPEVRVLSVPATSMGAYTMAAKKAAKIMGLPTFAVIMTVELVPHKAAWQMAFTIEEAIEDEDVLMALEAKADAALEQLTQLPDVSMYEPPAPPKRANRALNKKAGRK